MQLYALAEIDISLVSPCVEVVECMVTNDDGGVDEGAAKRCEFCDVVAGA